MILMEDLAVSRNRLEALVDGIFAFAMTLLITGLVIPHFLKAEAEAKLAVSIGEMKSEFISFLISFFVLASFWHRHNWLFHHVRRVDSGIMRITLFILAFVVVLPFTTNISGDYSHVRFAVDLFHINIFSLGLFFLIHWWYLTRNPHITSVVISSRDAAKGMLGALVTPFIAALGFAFSYINPSLSMAAYILIIPCAAILKRCFRDDPS